MGGPFAFITARLLECSAFLQVCGVRCISTEGDAWCGQGKSNLILRCREDQGVEVEMLVALETYHHLYAQVDQCLASGLAIKSSTCVDVHKVDATKPINAP